MSTALPFVASTHTIPMYAPAYVPLRPVSVTAWWLSRVIGYLLGVATGSMAFILSMSTVAPFIMGPQTAHLSLLWTELSVIAVSGSIGLTILDIARWYTRVRSPIRISLPARGLQLIRWSIAANVYSQVTVLVIIGFYRGPLTLLASPCSDTEAYYRAAALMIIPLLTLPIFDRLSGRK